MGNQISLWTTSKAPWNLAVGRSTSNQQPATKIPYIQWSIIGIVKSSSLPFIGLDTPFAKHLDRGRSSPPKMVPLECIWPAFDPLQTIRSAPSNIRNLASAVSRESGWRSPTTTNATVTRPSLPFLNASRTFRKASHPRTCY